MLQWYCCSALVGCLQDLVQELTKMQWYADRKGENPPGKKPYYLLPIFNYYKVSPRPTG